MVPNRADQHVVQPQEVVVKRNVYNVVLVLVVAVLVKVEQEREAVVKRNVYNLLLILVVALYCST